MLQPLISFLKEFGKSFLTIGLLFVTLSFCFSNEAQKVANEEFSLSTIGKDEAQKIPSSISEGEKETILNSFINLPLKFIKNTGQVDEKVKFYAKDKRGTIWFLENEVVFDYKNDIKKNERYILKLKIEKSNKNAEVEGRKKLKEIVNYFIGNDPSKWKTNIPVYSEIYYKNIYKGIDLCFYRAEAGELEYDFIVHPYSDPSKIKIIFEGTDVKLAENGDLIINTKSGEIRQKKPYIYQKIGGEKIEVEGAYRIIKLRDKTIARFHIKEYEKKYDLFIDPIMDYSTYLGGSKEDYAYGIAIDSYGYTYVTGSTESTDFPVKNAYQGSRSGYYDDAFVAKINPSESGSNSLVYSTYLGGTDYDYGYSIAVDNSGNAYVTGYTQSTNFPMQNSYNNSYNGGGDVFFTKLSSTGSSLLYSTYLGGSYYEGGYGITLDSSGNAYLTGYTTSPNFPTLNPYDATCGTDGNCNYNGWQHFSDVFLAKFDPSQSGTNSLIYSTFLGGSKEDYGYGITVSSTGNAFITGKTDSNDFPVYNAYDPTYNGIVDAFITKFSSAGNSLEFSTFFGGSAEDEGRSIKLDSSENIYVTGITEGYFPTVNGYDDTSNGYEDIFFSKFISGGLILLYSTYLGGGSSDYGYGIAIDSSGNAYITGSTYSTDFPVLNPYQGSKAGGCDAFITKIDPTQIGSDSLIYSTYFGGNYDDRANGIAVNNSGSVYITGTTESSIFPVKNAYQLSLSKNTDAFVSKLSNGIPSSFDLYIIKLGTGSGTVISDPSGINCGSDCLESYSPNTNVTLTANSDSGSTFSGWGGSCSSCGSNQNCNITINFDKSCSATFNPIPASTLTIYKTGLGEGTVNATGCTLNWNGNMGTCTVPYNTNITISGTSGICSQFAGWSNGTGSASGCSGTGDCSFALTQNSQVNAQFNLSGVETVLSENFEQWVPQGWSVVNNGGDCIWQSTQTTDRSNYTGGSGYAADADSDLCGDETTMNTELRTPLFDLSNTGLAKLQFKSDFYDFEYLSHGYVEISTNGGSNWATLLHYDRNDYRGPRTETIDLSSYLGSSNTMIRFRYVTPTWDFWWEVDDVIVIRVPANTLTVTKSGTGSGTVTSNPEGINCGSDCVEQYASCIDVILSAQPNPNSTFSNWTGDCSTCGSSPDCVVSMGANKNCSAVFASTSFGPRAIPDGRFSTVPVLVTKSPDGTQLNISWDNLCAPERTNIIYGDLSSISSYTISGSKCNISNPDAWNIGSTTNIWFVLVSDNLSGTESSWGLNSQGQQRNGENASGQCGNNLRDNSGTCP